jgi:hypothetical protein
MAGRELHKIEWKNSRFLYSNAALFACKNIYIWLVKLQKCLHKACKAAKMFT